MKKKECRSQKNFHISRKTSVFVIEVKNFIPRTREIRKSNEFIVLKVKNFLTGQGKIRFLKLK